MLEFMPPFLKIKPKIHICAPVVRRQALKTLDQSSKDFAFQDKNFTWNIEKKINQLFSTSTNSV